MVRGVISNHFLKLSDLPRQEDLVHITSLTAVTYYNAQFCRKQNIQLISYFTGCTFLIHLILNAIFLGDITKPAHHD
jgi:hypothetical protein